MPPKKNTSCEDESVVTMAMVTQLLEQQKEVYKEMLNLQQENFKGFIQVMIDGTNKRLDGVIKDVQELKTSLEFTQNKVEEETSGHKEIEAKIKSFESQNRTLMNCSQSWITLITNIKGKISSLMGYLMLEEKNGMNWSLKFNKCSLVIWSLIVPRLRWSGSRGLVSTKRGEGQEKSW